MTLAVVEEMCSFEKSRKCFKNNGETSQYDTSFTCLPCAPGCTTCIDDRPCILTLNWVQRSIVLAVACIIVGFIPLLVLFTVRYRNVKLFLGSWPGESHPDVHLALRCRDQVATSVSERYPTRRNAAAKWASPSLIWCSRLAVEGRLVMRAASPVLLRIVLLGAFLLYCPMIVQYFEPSPLTCSITIWMRELGFSISYGALLLKTWRISVVFRVRSAQRIKISDTDLIKRLALIVLIFGAYLSVRMVIGRPQIVNGVHSNGLRTKQCSWDVWDYCAAIAELGLLLWGIRLCIVVRKAPSEFNESRFISWAIYNETLLSLFLNITMFFLQSPSNPDLLYLVRFIHTQLTTTVTLTFLFGSKAYLVYKYREREHPQTTINRGSKYTAAP
ncbi:hypothetical protein NP493_697g01005 [Ridgeia piscesae]|uniref:G-protein coupled receptors family 3 profile domain-containing protein n=1 Tax=Ridgeia piscesae TaxID=27915 RepID=A0AAD9KQY9_RIDPI|nr:hypothetical protein NP493_697g01005 [Ridgeia piscesae]